MQARPARLVLELFALASTGALVAACVEPPPPPISLFADTTSLVANGRDSTTLTAELGFSLEGAVVQWQASGGVLSESVALPQDDVASVTLFADDEAALGRAGKRPLTVRASIELATDERYEAELVLDLVAPSEGEPVLFLEADPPAADADGVTLVDLLVVARRVAPGTQLSFSSSAGELLEVSPVADVDGELLASARLRAPSEPADVTVDVQDEASGATAALVVRFVRPGDPQFDLSGTFAQLAPARLRLSAASLVPDPQCVVAPSLVLVDVEQSGLDVRARFTTCEVSLPAVNTIVGEVTNETLPSFLAAIPVVEHDFSLDGAKLGATWKPPASIVVVGAELADPEHEALPTEADDPRVRDDDDDGQPGVTVLNSLGGEQSVAFRNVGRTEGRVVSSTRIEGNELGSLLAVTETSVFGIGGSFLPPREALPSVVQLLRVDGRYGAPDVDVDGDGNVSCDELLVSSASLFDLVVPDTPLDCGGL